MTSPSETKPNLLRPIIGIENRSAQEVFDIMCDRIKHASPQPVQDMHELPEVVATLRERDGQEFDGEIHLSSAEGEMLITTISSLTQKLDRAREALEMIAGNRPCPDRLMGNADIALAALSDPGDTP